jgi:putative salt-induced outer membrane protein
MLLRYCILTILIVCAAFADQITMINGDRLSGRIQRLEGGKLLLLTDMAGALTLPWSNVGSIVSTQPLYVILKDGLVFTGTIVNAQDGMRLQDSNRSMVVPRESIVTVRSFDEQIQFQRTEERKLAPHFLDPWTGFVDLGVSLSRGNADVTTYSLNGNGVRATRTNKLSTYFNSLYATNRNQPPPGVTANVRRGGARMEFNFNPKQFAFVSADFEFDELQRLDLRSVGAAGFGWHVAKTNRNTFDLFAGLTVNREVFATGLKRLSSEALLSEESSHRVNSLLTFKQRIALFPNLTDTGQYRATGDSSAVMSLARWLSWQVSASSRYISNPVPGSRRHDLLFTTGFRFNLLPPKI